MLKFFPILILASLNAWAFDPGIVEADITELFSQYNKPVELQWQETQSTNELMFSCAAQGFRLQVRAKKSEQIATLYYGLRHLGFLFPHPRIKIAPANLSKSCEKTFQWNPAFDQRGFHLHTQHPSEWIDGFFLGKPKIAEDFIWWLIHNQQNLLQLELIRTADLGALPKLIQLAHALEIQFGFSVSFAQIQQRSFSLIPSWRVLLGIGEEQALTDSLLKLMHDFNFDFLSVELGQTEFTRTDDEKTLQWINLSAELLAKQNRKLMTKAHVSTKQVSAKHGNFNFIAKDADPSVGIQVHTVYFYGLLDEHTPLYGRHDFSEQRDFMQANHKKRRIWYFPETSYFVGMDIDVPLFLTDYLQARASDSQWLMDHDITAQINFTTGQELGYWLFDWNFALQTDPACLGDSLCGIRLLGEDPAIWQRILAWQTEFFKRQQAIQMLTTSNLMDEIPWASPLHERVILRKLVEESPELLQEIKILQAAFDSRPDISGVKNPELKAMLQVTELRVQHALCLREAIDKKIEIQNCSRIRLEAKKLLQELAKTTRYPESIVFSNGENPTSYTYGYGWPAAETFFWEREERIIAENRINPWFMNLYQVSRLLF